MIMIWQFYPGALFLLALFYTKKEIATRMALFYTGNMIASSFAGLIAAGVFAGLDGVRGLAGWRWYVTIYCSLFRSIANLRVGSSCCREHSQSWSHCSLSSFSQITRSRLDGSHRSSDNLPTIALLPTPHSARKLPVFGLACDKLWRIGEHGYSV